MKFSMNYADWKAATNHVKRALSKNPSRPGLMNCRYECDGLDTLRLIAMNNCSLSTANLPVHFDTPCEPFAFVAPIPGVGKKGKINCEVREDQVLFSSDKSTIAVAREANEYPDWKKIIPENKEVVCYFNVTRLRQALDGLPKDTIIGINFPKPQEVKPIQIGAKGFYSIVMPWAAQDATFDIEP